MTDQVLPQEIPPELWRHASPEQTRMWEFKDIINKNYGLQLKSYDDLYQWSIKNIEPFWHETWQFTGITASKPYPKVRMNSFIIVT